MNVTVKWSGISSSLSSSRASCFSACRCSPPPGWNCVHSNVHLFLLVLDRGQRNLLKGWFHTLPVFGAGGQVLDFGVAAQEILQAGVFHLTVLFAVDFVAHQDEGEFLGLLGRPLVQELGYPGLDVVEGLWWGQQYAFVGYVVDEDAAIGPAVECAA